MNGNDKWQEAITAQAEEERKGAVEKKEFISTKTKVCRTCKSVKPLYDFPVHARSFDKHATRCNDCVIKGIGSRSGKIIKEKKDIDNPLVGFTPRELISELKRRGYGGTLTYTQEITL